MEEENKNDNINVSLSHQKDINNINIQEGEKENNENKDYSILKSDNNINNNYENNIKEELINNIEVLNKNYMTKHSNTDDIKKKINSQKVNTTLNDIYGSIANINEVTKRVKSLLAKRPKINKSLDNKRNTNFPNKIFKTKEEINSRKINFIYDLNIPNQINYIEPKTTKFYFKYGSKDNSNINNINNISNKKTYNNSGKKNNKNNSCNISNKKKSSYYTDSYNKEKNNINNLNDYKNKNKNPAPNNKINVILNQNDDNNNYSVNENIIPIINNDYTEDKEYFLNNYSISSSLKSSEITNMNNSSLNSEGFENEKDIRNIKLKLRKEEAKLRDLEEEKHRLLKEEKIRRKIIMENIKKKNKLKKQVLMKTYKKKINLIRKLQNQNIEEIKQLEKNKKLDENKLRKINNFLKREDFIINKNLFEGNHKKSRQKRNEFKDNLLNDINIFRNENTNEKETLDNKNFNQYFTFSDDYVKNDDLNTEKDDINKEENNLTNEYKYINTLYDLSSSEKNSNNNNSNKSNLSLSKNNYQIISNNKDKMEHKLINYLDDYEDDTRDNKNNFNPYNYFTNLNNQKGLMKNNKHHYNNRNSNLENYLIHHNTEKKKYYKFNSDFENYGKRYINNNNTTKLYKKYTSPKIDIPSFIQSRVNKYNYSNSKKSNSSKRLSPGQMTPYSFNYNFNYKYNYNMPSNITNRSNLNYFQNNNELKDSKKKERKKGDLNFKYIFF